MAYDSSGNLTCTKVDVVLSTPQSGTTLGVAAIEIRATSGGSNLATTTGNASCDATGSNPGNAVDGNASTFFTGSGTTVRFTYLLSSASQVGEVKVIARNDGSFAQAPTTVAVLAYNDAGNAKMIRGVATGLSWTSGSTNTITIPVNSGSYRTFRAKSTLYANG
jgi:hypothetical protein